MRSLVAALVIIGSDALTGGARPPDPRVRPRGKSKGRSRALRDGDRVKDPSLDARGPPLAAKDALVAARQKRGGGGRVREDDIDAREARLAAKFAGWTKPKRETDDVVGRGGEKPRTRRAASEAAAAAAFGGWKTEPAVVPEAGFLLRRPSAVTAAPLPRQDPRESGAVRPALSPREKQRKRDGLARDTPGPLDEDFLLPDLGRPVRDDVGEAPSKPRPAPARGKTLADAPPAFADDELPSETTWEAMGLDVAAAALLREDGFERPTAVQSAMGDAVLRTAPRDVLLAAPTGSGKTLAYLLPALAAADAAGPAPAAPLENGPMTKGERAAVSPRGSAAPAVLVIAPGRELAVQVDRVTKRHFPGVASQVIVGGANRKRQIDALRKAKPALITGTPGRLVELAFEGSRPLKLAQLRWCVIDEADNMCKAPFVDDVEALVAALPRACGVIFASATCDALVAKTDAIAERAAHALRIDATAAGRAGPAAKALVAKARHARLRTTSPLDALRRLLRADAPVCEAALVFVDDPQAAQTLANKLASNGVDARVLVGDAHSTERADAVRHLNEGAPPAVVVATEGAARGLDCTRVSHVVNYLSVPSSAGHYAHRAGRAGRAAATPAYVVSFTKDAAQERLLGGLERDLGVRFHAVDLAGGAVRLASS